MNNLLCKRSCITMLNRSFIFNRQKNFCSTANKPSEMNNEWRIIYKFPMVRLASAFNRLKFYQAGLTVLGVPAAQMVVSMTEAPPQTTYVAAIIGLTGLTTLTVGSVFFKNLVGLIYINKKEDHVKLAYVDFWGRRQHTVIPTDEILPEWEAKKSRFQFYHPIKSRNNEKQTFKLIHRFGVVTEKNTFSLIFN